MVRSLKGRGVTVGGGRPLAHPITADPAQYKGIWAYFADGIMRYSTGTEWRSAALTIDPDAEAFARISSPITKTVGAGGDYATLGEALEFFSGFLPTATSNEWLGTINILSGTTLAEQIAFYGVDLSWVKIVSEDAAVDVNQASLSNELPADTDRYPFMYFGNAGAPTIATKFNAINTIPNAGASVGLYLQTAEYVSDPGLASISAPPDSAETFVAGLTGFGENVRVGGESRAFFVEHEFLNATATNVITSGGSSTFVRCRQRGSAEGIRFDANSRGVISMSDFNLVADTDADDDIILNTGSVVSILGTTSGGTAKKVIVPDADGILFDTRNTDPLEFTGLMLPTPYTLATLPDAAAYENYLLTTTDDGALRQSDGTNWNIVGQTGPGLGAAWDAFGTFADRDDHDAEAAGFVYLATDGDAGGGAPAVIYIKNSATSADWSSAIAFGGPAGPKGDKGDTGDTGQQGATGPAGSDGADGADGADGRTVLNGTGAPANGLGVDGDFYIDTDASAIYGPKASGSWPSTPTSLIGPKGDQGAGIRPLGELASTGDLPASGTLGDGYVINRDLHVWTAAGQWENLGEFAGTDGVVGVDGREVELQTNSTHVQWRYVGEATWNDLFAIQGDEIAPAGEVQFFAVAPGDGWVECNGQALTEASTLRTALLDASSPFGTSGSDPRVPDVGGRVIAGKEATATRLTTTGINGDVTSVDGATVGATGGADRRGIQMLNGRTNAATDSTTSELFEIDGIGVEPGDPGVLSRSSNVQPTIILHAYIRLEPAYAAPAGPKGDKGDKGDAGAPLAAVTQQSGTSYTLALTDAEDMVEFTSSSAVTVTVPPNSSAAFEVGSVVTLAQDGTGAVSIAAGAGVTIKRGPNTAATLAGQHSVAQLAKVAADTWRLFGDLEVTA